MSINKIFCPKGLVVIGSASKGKLGFEILKQVSEGGFINAFTVNPKAQGAFSIPGYSTIKEIDHPVDLAVIVSPPHTVPKVLDDCGQANVEAAVIITAGYSEIGNVEGERELVKIAQKYNLRFVGPNCAGIINTETNLFPTLEIRPPSGSVALISQSGALGGIFLSMAKEYGLGISKFVSYGNAADLTEVDFIRYLSTDPDTQVVLIYIESVTDGREFMQALYECSAHKPVVVIKAGRTESGRRATLSHTGSMSGSDIVYGSAINQGGALRVNDIERAFDLCTGFQKLPRIEGNRIAIVTNSGGPGVLAADRAEEMGLDVAEPTAALSKKLMKLLPPHCAIKNPFDLTVEGTEAGYRETLKLVLKDFDMGLVLNIAPPYLDSLPLARGICDAAEQTGKPIAISFLPGSWVDDGIEYASDKGVPNFASAERAVEALSTITNYYTKHNREQSWMEQVLPKDELLDERGHMLEPQAMEFLKNKGFPVPNFQFATSEQDALKSSEVIGYPVVMKVVSREILHKSDAGGVILNIKNEREGRSAYKSLMQKGEHEEPQGVVIYPLISGAVEVLMGLSQDPQFGPVVVFGLGGIYTEIFRDITLRVAPIDFACAQDMIREIKTLPILQGQRTGKTYDLDAVADVLVMLSRLQFLYPQISEVDLNPVFVLPKGAIIGDARVILGRSE